MLISLVVLCLWIALGYYLFQWAAAFMPLPLRVVLTILLTIAVLYWVFHGYAPWYQHRPWW